MIQTLAITVVVEGSVCFLYSIRRKKPLRPILLTSVLANLLTQSMLWIVLNIFYKHYLLALLVAEVFIWIIEGYILFGLRFNQLKSGEAFSLSLIMNVSSFALGWLLPV